MQQALEEAVLAATGERATVHGAGRTDTGVHALGQVAHLFVGTRLDDDRLRHALNAHLPEGVVVREAETCADDFHARFSALSKRYAYHVVTTRFRPAFGAERAHWTSWPLDVARMRRASRALIGTHDFAAFAQVNHGRESTVRTVYGCTVSAPADRCLVVEVAGSGFLYNMVRIIAGTLVEAGRGKVRPEDIRRALATGDRTAAGPTLPPHGLRLEWVRYGARA